MFGEGHLTCLLITGQRTAEIVHYVIGNMDHLCEGDYSVVLFVTGRGLNLFWLKKRRKKKSILILNGIGFSLQLPDLSSLG